MKTVLLTSLFALSLAAVPALIGSPTASPMTASIRAPHMQAEGEAMQVGRAYAEGEATQVGRAYAEGEATQVGRAYAEGEATQVGRAYAEGEAIQVGRAYAESEASQLGRLADARSSAAETASTGVDRQSESVVADAREMQALDSMLIRTGDFVVINFAG